MIIERADRILHLYEMKFSTDAYRIKPEYERRLRESSGLFKELTKTDKTVVHTFITTYGVANGKNVCPFNPPHFPYVSGSNG